MFVYIFILSLNPFEIRLHQEKVHIFSCLKHTHTIRFEIIMHHTLQRERCTTSSDLRCKQNGDCSGVTTFCHGVSLSHKNYLVSFRESKKKQVKQIQSANREGVRNQLSLLSQKLVAVALLKVSQRVCGNVSPTTARKVRLGWMWQVTGRQAR